MPVYHKWGGGLGHDLPKIVDSYDEFLLTEAGTEIVDAAAGAAVANLGHSVFEDEESVTEAGSDLGYISLSHFTADAPKSLAEKVAAVTPGALDAALFAGSGSEANEAAIKFASAYHTAKGDTDKSVVVGRWQSYHGSTIGALSASGHTARRRGFADLLKDWPHIGPAYPYRWGYEGSEAEQARQAARELETAIRQQGPEHVAAFVAEPVGGSSIPAAHPHPDYYREIRRICDEYDVLFVADEVMTGFGRTGEWFGMDHYEVVPDIMTIGKGMSGGYAPISATMIREDIAEEFERDLDGRFRHGHTYSGHPRSSAIAAAVLDRYSESVLETGRERGAKLEAALEPVRDHPMVGDFRRKGMMVGMEFVKNPDTKEPFDPDRAVSDRIYDVAFEEGVYVYPGGGSVDGQAGDHLLLAPPLNIRRDSVERIADAVDTAVRTVGDEVGISTA